MHLFLLMTHGGHYSTAASDLVGIFLLQFFGCNFQAGKAGWSLIDSSCLGSSLVDIVRSLSVEFMEWRDRARV